MAGRLEGTHHDLGSGRQRGELLASELSEPALDSVTHHRGADGLADHEAHASLRALGWVGLHDGVDDQGLAPSAPTAARDAAQVVTAVETVGRR